MAHLDAIEAHNAKFEAGLSTYKQGINQFSDLTFEEFENTVLMREQSYVQVRNIVSEGGTGENRRIDPYLNFGNFRQNSNNIWKKICSDPHLD